MKRLVISIGLLFIISGSGYAEEFKIDCKIWIAWKNEQKTIYLAGYVDALGMLGVVLAADGKSPVEIQKAMNPMWPQGYNLGKLGDELDKLCPAPVFNKMRLTLVISSITARAPRGK